MSLVGPGKAHRSTPQPGPQGDRAEGAGRPVPPAPRSAPNSGFRTALQKHVDFFDTDHDGKITLSDTYHGLRRLGLGARALAAFAGVINAALGSSTSGAPSLTVDAGAHPRRQAPERHRRLRHEGALLRCPGSGGSSPGTTPTATARSTAEELARLFAENRTDLVGHLGSKAEFGLLLDLAGEERNGKKVLTREPPPAVLQRLAVLSGRRGSRGPARERVGDAARGGQQRYPGDLLTRHSTRRAELQGEIRACGTPVAPSGGDVTVELRSAPNAAGNPVDGDLADCHGRAALHQGAAAP